MGSDPGRRTAALDRAVRAGLPAQKPRGRTVAAPKDAGPIGAALFGGQQSLLAHLDPEDRDRARRNIAKLKAILAGRSAA